MINDIVFGPLPYQHRDTPSFSRYKFECKECNVLWYSEKATSDCWNCGVARQLLG